MVRHARSWHTLFPASPQITPAGPSPRFHRRRAACAPSFAGRSAHASGAAACREDGTLRCERPRARAPCARPNPVTVTRESPQPSPGGAARAAHAPVASDSPASQSESQAPRDRGPRPIPRQKGPEDRRPLQGPSAFAQGSCTVPGCTTTYFNNYSWARR